MATIQEINLVRTNTPAGQSPQKIHPLCAGAAVTASVVGGKLVFALGINKALLVSGIAAIAAGLFTMGFSSGYLAALKK